LGHLVSSHEDFSPIESLFSHVLSELELTGRGGHVPVVGGFHEELTRGWSLEVHSWEERVGGRGSEKLSLGEYVTFCGPVLVSGDGCKDELTIGGSSTVLLHDCVGEVRNVSGSAVNTLSHAWPHAGVDVHVHGKLIHTSNVGI